MATPEARRHPGRDIQHCRAAAGKDGACQRRHGTLGSGKDRHHNIGKGNIGLRGFTEILSRPAMARLPFILETPVNSPKTRSVTWRHQVVRSMKTYHEGAVQNYLSEEARRKLSDAIRQAGGAEVFAVGRCDRDYIVIDVDVLSVGHMSAAPVVSAALMRGQVVLHNHPSGQLMPSDADLAVASALAQKGIGFWIVDNAVQRIRPVTDPMTNASGSIVIAPADIEHLFSDHGLLAKGYPDYEPRPGQLLMALKVTEALSTVSHLVVEAGTGTGKSLAYLAPIVLWAQRNEARVVVSTNTINLQEQLIASDIPALAKALGEPVRACLVKGRANYLCLRKLDTALAEDYLSDELAPIVSWAQTTVTGDRSTMPEPSPEAWERY